MVAGFASWISGAQTRSDDVRPHGKYAAVNAQNPEALAQCDRCSFWRNRSDLVWQTEWSGTHLYNIQVLVCQDRCFDTPQEQFRTIILPPDPPPVLNARPPNFAYEEQTVRIIQFGGPNAPPWGAGPEMVRATQSGEQVRILQYQTSS
jgi:hypothetical protein